MEQPPEILRHGEVELRRWRANDLETLYQVATESLDHLRPWMPWAANHDRKQYEGFLARSNEEWEAGQDYTFAITALGAVIGSCGLHRRAEPRVLEIGYWLHPARTGKGFATMAAAALVDAGKGIPDVDRIEIRHDEANPASGAVARRLGFAEVERVREPDGPDAPGEVGVTVIWRLETRAASSG
ncbi:GNAT family N-acetyltransferase [Streptomyces sp. NBC_00445]|uniref:GNAT family N-acetyltransferase n=1 Tax=unclassified Streptomyces TaxID=2593676 RepID=UPI002E21EBFD|nr:MULTISPECIES: GNAT family N-acetyltransferase [unclassified Streptomyces]